MNYVVIQKIFNDGSRKKDFKTFNTLLEAKCKAYSELSKVHPKMNLEAVKVAILNENLNLIFHDTNGESSFDIKIT